MHSCPDHIVMDAVACQTAPSQTELPAMRSGRSGSSKSPSRRSERRHSPTPYSAQRLHRSAPPLHGKPELSSIAKLSINATGDANVFARACEIQVPSVSLSARLDILEQNGTKTCVPEPDGDGFLLHMECEDDERSYLDEDMIVRECVETKVSSSNSFNNEVSQTIRDHNSNISVIKDVTCDEEMLESASVNSSSSAVVVSCTSSRTDGMSGLLEDSNLNNLPQTFSVELTGENVVDGKTKMDDNEDHDDKKDYFGTKLNACVISLSKMENEIGPGQDISLTCGYRTLPSSLASGQPQTESRQVPRCVCLQRVWNKSYLLPALSGFPPLVFPHNVDTIILHTPQSNPYNPNLPTPCIVLTQYTSYEMCRKCEGYRLWSKSEDCMQVCGEEPLFEKAAVSHSLKLGEEVDFAYHNVNTEMSNGCPDDKCPHKCRSEETKLHNLVSEEKTNQEHMNLDSFCMFCSVQQHVTACAGQQDDVCAHHHSNCSRRKYSLSETKTVFSLEPNHAFLEEKAPACHYKIVPTLRNPENDFPQDEHCWAEGRNEDLQQFWSPVPDCLPSPILSCQVSEAPGPVGEPVQGSSGTSTRADIISRLRRVLERRLSGTDEPGYLRNSND